MYGRLRICSSHLWRQFRTYSSETSPPSVAIVGGGPAGFYTAQKLLRLNPNVCVDMYEKLPVPYGLVRFGVAPDHPEVKNVISKFEDTASQPRFRFYGNITVGQDVSMAQLRRAYRAVVLSYGADNDKRFGIPGEDLNSIYSARSFVGWYNGLPEDSNFNPSLDSDTAVILGQGNVAMDVARMLLSPIDQLRKTDITEFALDALSRSRVRRVFMVGRRGPLQAAFTIAELREMLALEGVCPVFNQPDFDGLQNIFEEIPRPKRRISKLLVSTALDSPSEEQQKRWASASKEWNVTFLRSPTQFVPSVADAQRVGAVEFNINRLESSGKSIVDQRAVATDEKCVIEAGVVFRSIGYRSRAIDDLIPFDSKNGVIPNEAGRVTSEIGLYCSGWVKTGPVGVIASTMNSSVETAKVVHHDLESTLTSGGDEVLRRNLKEELQSKGIRPVTFAEWTKIDAVEVEEGEQKGKPREKITDIQRMLQIAHQ